jgi:O-antigen/teichoic acid export membrane protein
VSDNNTQMASGVGHALLGRLGALVEIVSLTVFAALYGTSILGIFVTLWAVLRIAAALGEFAMTTALQRYIPRAGSSDEASKILSFALAISLSLAIAIASVAWAFAPQLAGLINASDADAPQLANIISVYVWVLPFWTMIKVLSASVRAKHKFGPEIRIRIFYEQGLRLAGGVAFYFAGFHKLGLFYAHLVSVMIAAGMAVQLASRFYRIRLFQIPDNKGEILSFAAHMMPANLVKRVNSELPTLALNMMLPGVNGANAAAYFSIARKIVSTLQVVRQSFEYVLAPFASQKVAEDKHDELQDMYAFSLRLIAAIIIPLGFLLMMIRNDLLGLLFSDAFMVASTAMVILAIGRIVEGLTGPASALIEMLGHKSLPLINGALGTAVLLYLLWWLIPQMGINGAAIAAAAGLNVIAILSMLEAAFIYRLNPYTAAVFRAIAVALTGSSAVAIGFPYVLDLGPIAAIIYAIAGVLVSLGITIRYALDSYDRLAMGRIGRFFGPQD